MSIYRVIEGAEAYALSSSIALVDGRNVLAALLAEANPGVTSGTIAASPMFVLHVGLTASITEIGEAIVRFLAVDVINFVLGPLARHIKPSQPAKRVLAPIKVGPEVPELAAGADNIANPVATSVIGKARKNARLGVIGEKFAQAFSGKGHVASITAHHVVSWPEGDEASVRPLKLGQPRSSTRMKGAFQ